MTEKWLQRLIIGYALFMAAVLFTTVVFAHDDAHPELDNWYKSLQSPKSPCCDKEDFSNGTAHHLADAEWETQNKENSHYRVNIDGEWFDVPDNAVVDGPNKDGRALVWFYPVWNNVTNKSRKEIRCFLPGEMT